MRTGARTVAVLLACAVPLGAVLGLLWNWWWSPPLGVVYGGEWFLQPAGPDLSFDGTALYVLIGAVAGLVAGVVAGHLTKGQEIATLVGVTCGAFVAAWVMFLVGQALGPADPQVLAAHQEDLATLPARLGVGEETRFAPFGTTAVLALPVGAVLGLATSLLTYQGRGRRTGLDGTE
ncbi:MAG: hypothetical protein ACI379_09060 [Nocardioides sp.]|uniref:hypothetical protein n=1 Tax=Nocardioides sp. TaxID=35761 RepID=UPI003EFDE109